MYRLSYYVVLFCTIFFLTSCHKTSQYHGYYFSDHKNKKIKTLEVGKTKIDTVLALFGEPTTIEGKNKTYFYIQQKLKINKLFYPKVVEQQILSISFDEDDIVKEVKLHKKQ